MFLACGENKRTHIIAVRLGKKQQEYFILIIQNH